MRWAVHFAAVLAAVGAASASAPANGDFEACHPGGNPVSWSIARGRVGIAVGEGSGGGNALSLANAPEGALATQDVEVIPGKLYELSADVKVRGAGEVCVFAEWFDGDGKWRGGVYNSNVRDTGEDWRHVSVLSKPVKPWVKKFRVQVLFKSADGGRALVDNVRLAEHVLPQPPDAEKVRYRYGKDSNLRVRVDSANRAIVDGEPYFPLGLYGGIGESDIVRLAGGPFNTLMVYSAPTVKDLDRAKRYGFKVIAGINHVWADNPLRPKSVKTEADADRWLGNYVSSLKGHDALLAWYLFDESPITEIGRLAKRRDFMWEADPDHPCWAAMNVPELTAWYLDAFDVAGSDPYPISRDPISMVSEWTRLTREGTKGQRAIWMIPQIFDYRNWGRKDCRIPTRDEIRNMTWQCIAEGANGIVYFKYGDLKKNPSGDGTFERRWADVLAVANEVKDFVPVLLSAEAAPPVGGMTEAVRARAFRLQGRTHLVVVNVTRAPVKATLTVDGEDRPVSLKPLGVLIDGFPKAGDVEYVGHQGEELLAPSHTAAAYRLAVEHGLDYMKLDVHETLDGVIVTQHDADLRNTYGADAVIAKSNYADLNRLYAKPVGGYDKERICTFAQALEIAKPMKGLWIDFKQFSPEFMDRVFSAVEASGWRRENVMIATYNHWALKWAPRKWPGVRLVAHVRIRKVPGGYDLNFGEKGKVYADEGALADAIIAYRRKMGLFGVNMPAPHKWRTDRYATSEWMVRRLKEEGLWVAIWFVNNPEDGGFYRRIGVDAFVTGCAAATRGKAKTL